MTLLGFPPQQAMPDGEPVQWSHAGGRYVHRFVAADIDEGVVSLQGEGKRFVAQAALDTSGRRATLRFPGGEAYDVHAGRTEIQGDTSIRVIECRGRSRVRILLGNKQVYSVEAAGDRIHLSFSDGFRLTRFVRNMQLRTVARPTLCAERPESSPVASYANPLGRTLGEPERAIIIGAPLYCAHTPEARVSPFRLAAKARAMIAAITIASRLPLLHSLCPGYELSRDVLAVALGDGVVAAATLSAVGDIRTYSRAILGLPN